MVGAVFYEHLLRRPTFSSSSLVHHYKAALSFFQRLGSAAEPQTHLHESKVTGNDVGTVDHSFAHKDLLWVHKRNLGGKLDFDHHRNAPIDLKEHRGFLV